MATDILSALADMIFIGNVSSTIPEEGKAVVTRLDREGVVTAPLSVINRGAAHDKDYWMPDLTTRYYALCYQIGLVVAFLMDSLLEHSLVVRIQLQVEQIMVNVCSLFLEI